jgi:uncharacterized protein YdeI (YjbR/CyaY-like superfamily)
MPPESVTFFDSQDDFRAWLAANHSTASEIFVGFYRKDSGMGGLTYKQALDEALCYGWIDGVRHKLDDQSYSNRFSPRRKGSNWSRVNITRFHELREQGLIEPAGQQAFDAWDGHPSGYSFESQAQALPEEYATELRASPAAWEYWESRPPGYRRIVTHWLMDAKREETRRRRLAALIADCEAGQPIALLRRNTS